MKASKLTDAQKAFVIKLPEDGTPFAEVCRRAGISSATFFNWKKKYSGLMPSELKRLRELEHQSACLKKIVAGWVALQTGTDLASERGQSGEQVKTVEALRAELDDGLVLYNTERPRLGYRNQSRRHV